MPGIMMLTYYFNSVPYVREFINFGTPSSISSLGSRIQLRLDQNALNYMGDSFLRAPSTNESYPHVLHVLYHQEFQSDYNSL